uniref:RING-type domain-containing protein n=1 Tax=Amphora coffeiformis TaxID=265554 RepID=A0A7S3P509_9STRA|mmetsp:Transcript_11929/g.24211  ORF Transcript_11929/g.24211 Transcript_11929/m.24211 type:complete len:392 (+) Transcript_11929:123-1298(+)
MDGIIHHLRHLEDDQERSYPIKPETSTPQHNNNTSSGNHQSSTDMTTSTTTNMVVVGILVGLICILTCVLVLLLVRPVMDFVRSRLPENKRRKELRYRTVEGWVISKRLRGHDELCSHALGFVSEPQKNNKAQQKDGGILNNTPSYDTTETAEQSIDIEWTECPICMEEFKQGEIVSWSPDDETPCQHFFHHECIKEWLLRSPHCPYCRGTIIPVDETPAGSRVDKLTLQEMSKRRTSKANTTYCCVEHGLVTLQRKAMNKCSKRDKQILDAVLAPKVNHAELKAKRGGRQEEQAMSSSSSSSSSDSAFSSGLLRNGNTTILDAVHVVPPDGLIANVEVGPTDEAMEVALVPTCIEAELEEQSTSDGIFISVPDIESPPASGEKLRNSEKK